MSVGLGFCQGNADNLYQAGIATVTWTPDDSWGGTLTVAVPESIACTDPVAVGDTSYYVSLALMRGRCGQKFSINVYGQANSYFYAGTYVAVAGLAEFGSSADGTAWCGSPGDLVLRSGVNPCVATIASACSSGGGGSSGYINIVLYGYNSGSAAHSITVTVTAL